MMSRSDIPKNNWVDRYMPKFSRPYIRLARLDRPIGTWLLLLPCWWSLALGWKLQLDNTGLNELGYLYILFTLGALIMRGAGCTINDLWDRNMDKLVARTADRPIASGEISVKKAIKDALVCNKPTIVNVEVDPEALYSFRKDSFKHRAK